MFSIDYYIATPSFDKVDTMSDEELRYDFLLGGIIFRSEQSTIEMDWQWIPLLDFSVSLNAISDKLKNKKEDSDEVFEFTESAETLKFTRSKDMLNISASFSPFPITILFDEFKVEAESLRSNIGAYIKANMGEKNISKALNKYL